MYSQLPKVLHLLAGRSLLEHVYHAASQLQAESTYVVYGYCGETVREKLAHLKVDWVEQSEQLGTGHAVKKVLSTINDPYWILILYGDVPLITAETLMDLIDAAKTTGFSLLSAYTDQPTGYGRIIRNTDGTVLRIVEEQDATEEERKICEINTGMMVADRQSMKKWVNKLNNNNTQHEYYLTDIIRLAVQDGVTINTIHPKSELEIKGVNNRAELSELERYYQLVQAHRLMCNGVTIMDPSRFDLRGDIEIGADCLIDVNVIFEGRLKIGNRVHIGANCLIRNTILSDDVKILANTMIENAIIGKSCRIGPFAHIRKDTTLQDNVHIGNFVELKKSDIDSNSKINHLSYIGDAEVGRQTNIGAGVITCNYDGANKHKTIIGDDVFVGSDVQMVAPVEVHSGATIAAGTTITKNVDSDTLAISRTPQTFVPNWKRPLK